MIAVELNLFCRKQKKKKKQKKTPTNFAINLPASYNYTRNTLVTTVHSVVASYFYIFLQKFKVKVQSTPPKQHPASLLFIFEFEYGYLLQNSYLMAIDHWSAE